MSLYDEALAAGAPPTPRLSPELIQQILSGESLGNIGGYGTGFRYTDPQTGRVYTSQQNYGTTGTGESSTTDFNSLGPANFMEDLGNGTYNAYDQSGGFTGAGKYTNNWRDMIQAMAMVAPAVGGVIGSAGNLASGAGAGASAGAGAGAGSGAFLGEGVASGIGGWDQAFINAGGNFAPGAVSYGVNPQSPDATTQLQDLAQTPNPVNADGVQQIEVVGNKIGQAPLDVSAPIGGDLTMADLAVPGTAAGAATQVADYSNEGRNYPTPQSTQGSGGSPWNASQFPGTTINDVNGNPIGGAQVVPGGGGGGSGGSNPFGTGDFKNLFDVLSGLYGLKLAGDAREASDPFGPYRKGYADKLLALEADPGRIRGTPGFFSGQDAINRSMASKGYLGSGNQAAALQRFGGDFYQQEAGRLAGLAGAGIQPGNSYYNAADLAGRSLSNIGYGLSPYMSGGPR
jgi:hypothetical protein